MASLPIVPTEGTGLARYLDEIRRFPMLEHGEEYMLAKRWREHEDVQAAHRLVTSHLRLVAKIAMGYRGYGLPMNEIISEGNVGLMQAVKRFDPDRGFRLATYAMWWIRAAIQEYILHSWSLVKLGTTAAQKKLFFNLRRLKSQMQAIEEGDLSPEAVKQIATTLEVTEQDVIDMNRRLEGRTIRSTPCCARRATPSGRTGWSTTPPRRRRRWPRRRSWSTGAGCSGRHGRAQRAREAHRPSAGSRRSRPRWRISRRSTASAASGCARSKCARSRSCRRRWWAWRPSRRRRRRRRRCRRAGGDRPVVSGPRRPPSRGASRPRR